MIALIRRSHDIPLPAMRLDYERCCIVVSAILIFRFRTSDSPGGGSVGGWFHLRDADTTEEKANSFNEMAIAVTSKA